MFSTLVNAWKIKDIRTKMLYTMLLIVIYRLGSFIPVPGVNAAAITQYAEQYDMLGFLNLLSGGAFGDFSIFAMGISPYITGSIIIQLLTIAIPSLERLSKEEDGREKIEAITRYTGIGLAPEDLPRIFEKGFTGYNGRSDRKSTGIGLYLCRRILQKLGHSIDVQSEPGRGTCVRIDLTSAHTRHE